jgi:phytoene dehydrogenase-like protein
VSRPAVVIGAGADELVCAHRLARAGWRVVVLAGRAGERDGASDPGWVDPALLAEPGLEARGLRMRHPDPWAAVPLAGGGRLELSTDMICTVEAIRRVSPRDAQIWPRFCERMAHLARLLETIYCAPPPDPVGRGLRELGGLAALAWRLRRLGREGIEDLLRLVALPVADWLDDWFEHDALKGALGAGGILHLRQGPRAGGTAFLLLHHHVGGPPGVFRPPLSNLRGVLAALPGIEMRRGVEVTRIRVRAGGVTGVVTAEGEEIAATAVVSGADPKRTLLELLEPGWLDPELARAARHIRARGVVAQVTLALERAPASPTLTIAPSLDHLERAHEDAKYGRLSRAPFLEALGAGAAADGRHRVQVHAQYAPYALAGGEWDAARRAALGELVVKTLGQYAAEYRSARVERVLAPPDLEREEGWPEGQRYHAEPALDQMLWMRPLPGWARCRTPVAGLYLCGPGTHPAGAVAGASGRNAAREILRDLRRGARLRRDSI